MKKIKICKEQENVNDMFSVILQNEISFFFNIDEFFAALLHTIMTGQYDEPFLEDFMLTGKILKQLKFKIIMANEYFWKKLGEIHSSRRDE